MESSRHEPSTHGRRTSDAGRTTGRTARRAIPLALAALAAFLLAAAPGCRPRDRRTPDDTVVYLFNDPDVTELDPRYAATSNDVKISRLVAPGLVTVDQPSLEPRLELAARVENVGPTTWEVDLRPDARFSDGSPVLAEDVVYTFESVLRPEMKSLSRRAFEERLASVEALGERRVRFELKQPLATFMTDLDFGIVSRRAALAQPGERWKDGRVIGAGPFAVVKLDTGETILERNRHYHGGVPPMRRVVVRTIRDANARLLVMVGGSADITQNTVRSDLIPDVARSPRLDVITGPSVILTYLMYNHEDPMLADRRVRQAIALAVDREKLVRSKFGGFARLATGLIAPGHWAYHGDVARWDHDPERARALLDEAGFPDPDGPGPGVRFTLTYKTSADPFRVSVARLIAQDLAEVGIGIELRSFEFATFFADIKKGQYQLASMQTGEIVEPDMNYVYFHSSRIPTKDQPDLFNRWRYRNPEADRLIIAGRHELDRERRKAIYAELQELLARDLPIFPLWHEDNIVVKNRDVVGYEILPNARLSGLAKVAKER